MDLTQKTPHIPEPEIPADDPPEFYDESAQPGPEAETVNARYLHNDIPLEKTAVEQLGQSLGLDVSDTLSLIQKGLNYDRLIGRAPSAAAGPDAAWVEFFKEHRDIDPADFTEQMLGDIEGGHSPLEVFLKQRLADTESEIAELNSRLSAGQKAIGSLASEVSQPQKDPFMEAFERALGN